jgi:very-short-patch-repair endonuclease
VPTPARPTALRGRVFRGHDAVARGLLTRTQLTSTAWRRLFRGVYADATLPDTHGVAIAGAALIIPPSAVFSGRSAAYLLGAETLAEPTMPVDVIVPEADRFGPVAGIQVRRTSLPDSDIRGLRQYSCTTPMRTALDIARLEGLPESVVALDVLLGRGLISKERLRAAAEALQPCRGRTRGRRAVDLADERAESPQESRLRVLLQTAGLTPVPQHVVLDAAGRFVARVDLAFPEHRIAIEYDGAWHGEAGQLTRDRRRLNKLVAAGWTVLHLTAADLHDPSGVLSKVLALLADRDRGVVRS